MPNPGDPQSLNRYSYAGNNPLRYTDPSGHYIIEDKDPPLLNRLFHIPDSQVFLSPNHPQNPTRQGLLVSASTVQTWGEAISVNPRLVVAERVLGEAMHMEWHYDENGNIDYRATLEEELGDVLLICAKTAGVNGVCGVSYGATGAGPVGIRNSVDFTVDASGDMAVYGASGGGAYATPLIATGIIGLSVFVAPGATVDDVQGWAVQFGGSVSGGIGVGVEWVIFSNNDKAFQGLVVSQYSGESFEIHGSATYSYRLYRSR